MSATKVGLVAMSFVREALSYSWVDGVSSTPAACPGRYCGRIHINTTQAMYSACGPCPRGWRVVNPQVSSLCEQCTKDPEFYDWLYLLFIFLTALLSHWVAIDFTAKRSRFTKEILFLHASAFGEVLLAAVISLVSAEPSGAFELHTCGVSRLSDWYPLLHNPNPNYEKRLYCTSEVVYPLYSMVFIFYALSLLFMLLVRPWISSKYLPGRGRSAIYAALYFFPILALFHTFLGGLIYYSFPYMIIILSLISSATHFAFKLDQTTLSLILGTLTDARNLVILLGHWLLHGFGIISITQLKEAYHWFMLLLVPLPALFYVVTPRFTNPQRINAVYNVERPPYVSVAAGSPYARPGTFIPNPYYIERRRRSRPRPSRGLTIAYRPVGGGGGCQR